jgi:hypothetical protein
MSDQGRRSSSPLRTPQPGASHAWRHGIRRVSSAPAVLLGAWLVTMIASLPFMLLMRGLLLEHLGASLAADTAASGINYDWMQEFAAQASGVGRTFRPAVIGFAAVLDNLSAFIDNSRPASLVAIALMYSGLWLFLAGGVINRFARDRATHSHGFFMASGVFFLRFLRLGLLMAAVYGALFRGLHLLMFDKLYPRLTHEVTVERTAFLIRVGLYLVFGFVLMLCNLVFDFAKIRAVVEDRRSMIGATAAAIRFLWRHGPAAIGLFMANGALFLVVLGAYAVVAPGVGGTGWVMWIGLLIGQLYILARLWVKLAFWASETSLFQGRLAHAGYVAAPAAEWPDSPLAEALARSALSHGLEQVGQD